MIFDGLRGEMRGLRAEIAALRAERDAAKRELTLSDEVRALKEEIVTLKIEKSKVTEEHAREERELRHMIGLEKKRQEVELAQATTAATLKVREENLSADKARFETEMNFTRDRFKEEVGYLKDMMKEVLARLPTVTVNREIGS